MDGIPAELIFVLIFIVFSILEGLGRKAKAEAKKRGGAGQAPGAPQRRSTGNREGGGRRVERVDAGVSGPGPAKGQDSSEGLIPNEVWEEILGLARGTPPAKRPPPGEAPVPETRGGPSRREDETLEVIPEFEARSLEPVDAPPTVSASPPARVRERSDSRVAPLPSALKGAPAPRGRLDGSGLRSRLFGSGSEEELRKAVVLQEVLGPPVGMRE